jgi:hypothetical protein
MFCFEQFIHVQRRRRPLRPMSVACLARCYLLSLISTRSPIHHRGAKRIGVFRSSLIVSEVASKHSSCALMIQLPSMLATESLLIVRMMHSATATTESSTSPTSPTTSNTTATSSSVTASASSRRKRSHTRLIDALGGDF